MTLDAWLRRRAACGRPRAALTALGWSRSVIYERLNDRSFHKRALDQAAPLRQWQPMSRLLSKHSKRALMACTSWSRDRQRSTRRGLE